MSDRRSIGVVLFHGFELLDVFGPLEMYEIAADHFDIRLDAATWAEYEWHRDAEWDPFAKLKGMPEALSSC